MAKNSNKGRKRNENRSNKNTNNQNTYKGANTKPQTEASDSNEAKPNQRNHFEYYNQYPMLIETAAKINTADILGVPTYLGNPASQAGAMGYKLDAAVTHDAIPGIMKITVVTGPGRSTDRTSAICKAATNIHTYVASKRSNAMSNYDSASLAMMMCAADSAIQWHTILKRVYGMMLTNSPQNIYYQRYLVHALGFDFDSLSLDTKQLANAIERLSIAMKGFIIPKLYIHERHRWLFSHVFSDTDISENPKSQLFFYQPYGFHFLNKEDISEKHGIEKLTMIPWDHLSSFAGSGEGVKEFLDIQDIMNINDKFSQILTYSTDFYQMMSDVLYAYENADVYDWQSEIELDDTFKGPVYDVDAIMQLHNATIIGLPAHAYLSDLDITQEFHESDPSWYIKWDPLQYEHMSSGMGIRLFARLTPCVDFMVGKPDTENVTRSTRLTVAFSENATGVDTSPKATFGTEFVCSIKLYNHSWDEGGAVLRLRSQEENFIAVQPYGEHWNFLDWITDYTLAPKVYTYTSNQIGSDQTVVSGHRFWTVSNYAYIPYDNLKSLHEACSLSEWIVKQVDTL